MKRLSPSSFRRHVLERAYLPLIRFLVKETRQTKVKNFDVPLTQHQIGRLDIAVNDALGMSMCQTLSGLQDDVQSLRKGNRHQQFIQSFTFKEGHDDEHAPVIQSFHSLDGSYMLVLKLLTRQQLSFKLGLLLPPSTNDFKRNGTPLATVLGFINNSRTTCSQLINQQIVTELLHRLIISQKDFRFGL